MRESLRSVRQFFTTDQHGFTRMLALRIRVHRCSAVFDFFWLRPQAALCSMGFIRGSNCTGSGKSATS
jgi:hypothetical protein